MKLAENPWHVGGDPSKLRDWKCKPQMTPYKVACPACGVHARAKWCDERHKDCRCDVCNERFDARENIERRKHG